MEKKLPRYNAYRASARNLKESVKGIVDDQELKETLSSYLQVRMKQKGDGPQAESSLIEPIMNVVQDAILKKLPLVDKSEEITDAKFLSSGRLRGDLQGMLIDHKQVAMISDNIESVPETAGMVAGMVFVEDIAYAITPDKDGNMQLEQLNLKPKAGNQDAGKEHAGKTFRYNAINSSSLDPEKFKAAKAGFAPQDILTVQTNQHQSVQKKVEHAIFTASLYHGFREHLRQVFPHQETQEEQADGSYKKSDNQILAEDLAKAVSSRIAPEIYGPDIDPKKPSQLSRSGTASTDVGSDTDSEMSEYSVRSDVSAPEGAFPIDVEAQKKQDVSAPEGAFPIDVETQKKQGVSAPEGDFPIDVEVQNQQQTSTVEPNIGPGNWQHNEGIATRKPTPLSNPSWGYRDKSATAPPVLYRNPGNFLLDKLKETIQQEDNVAPTSSKRPGPRNQ